MKTCNTPTACGRPGGGRRRAVALLAGLAGLAGLTLTVAACDIPTALPRFESRFVVPVPGPRVSAADLLPGSMSEAGDEFRLLLPPVHGERTQGAMCDVCRAAHLLVVPKPAFTHAFSVPLALPADVASATYAGGAILVQVRHGFSFDPLHPAGRAEDGSLTVVARRDGAVLGTVTFEGPLPQATTVSRLMPLAAGMLDGPVEFVATIVSPAGGPVAMNRNASLRIDIVPDALRITEARIGVTDRNVPVQPVLVDLSGVDAELRDRVRSGALVVVLDNPFTVAGDLELRLVAQASGTDVRRTVRIEPGAASRRIDLTQAELRGLLGERVTATLTGPLSGVDGPVTVRPALELTLDPRLDLLLEIGS